MSGSGLYFRVRALQLDPFPTLMQLDGSKQSALSSVTLCAVSVLDCKKKLVPIKNRTEARDLDTKMSR